MPVLARTINTFAAALPGAEIVAVLPEQHIGFWKNLSALSMSPNTKSPREAWSGSTR